MDHHLSAYRGDVWISISLLPLLNQGLEREKSACFLIFVSVDLYPN